jgi:hypothetical protein
LLGQVCFTCMLFLVLTAVPFVSQVVEWFQDSSTGLHTGTQPTPLTLCRIKNKFSFAKEDIIGGYRDLTLGVVFEDKCGLKIIGEIQIHDKCLYDLKSKVVFCPD